MPVDLKQILKDADIKVNGNRSWDVKVGGLVYQRRLQRIVQDGGVVALGDDYVNGGWDCSDLVEFFSRMIKSGGFVNFRDHPTEIAQYELERSTNLQQVTQARKNIGAHYDTIPEEVFKSTLDKRMTYSTGIWDPQNPSQTLDEAQEAKLDLVCRKLGLKEGMRVLDIGSGWGSFVGFAAENYGVEAVGITISENQAEFSRRATEGLPVEIRLQDYRELCSEPEEFDRIASIGMFEHVGHHNYRDYMQSAHAALKNGGLFLLHNFGSLHATPTTNVPEARWVGRHIFPAMDLASIEQITAAGEEVFKTEDVHEISVNYVPTLRAWTNRFNEAWPTLQPQLETKYGAEFGEDKFSRFWNYYLQSSEAGIKEGVIPVWQTVFSKGDIDRPYEAVR